MQESDKHLTETVELKSIPIFRAGTYPQGVFDEDFIQRLADNYDPEFHEAPMYLTHKDSQKDISAGRLAFGWVKRLYTKGKTLFADIANVPKKFAELLLAGRIKKRSVEIYSDLSGKGPYLRAIAWPLIPEVKGLADIHPTQVFNEESQNAPYVSIKQSFSFKEKDKMRERKPSPSQFITRDVFKSTLEQYKKDIINELRDMLIELEVKSFCEQMVLAGKMSPAERETEEPILINERKRELTMNFDEAQRSLSEKRMEYYRTRKPILRFEQDKEGPFEPIDQSKQKVINYFHEHSEFFTRLGISVDDLLLAEQYQKTNTNPLIG